MGRGGRRAVVAVALLVALRLAGPHNWPARVRGWVGTPLGRRLLTLGAVAVLVAALAVAGVAGGTSRAETGGAPALAADAGGASPEATMPEPSATGGATSVAPAAPTKPLVSVLKYTVQPGDTLRTIAEQFGVAVGELIAANRLADPDALSPGQALVIPLR